VLKNYYVDEIKVSFKFDSSAKRVVDFRSGWALSWGRPMSRFTRFARSRVSSVTLIPKESPSLHSNQPFHKLVPSGMSLKIYSDKTKLQQWFLYTKAKCQQRGLPVQKCRNNRCTIVSLL